MLPVLTLALKDLRLLLRDRMGLFFIVVFPVVMGLFFGLMGASFEPENQAMQIGVVDVDDSTVSRGFVQDLSNIDTVEVVSLDRETAVQRVRKGRLIGYVAIPEHFGETAGIFWAKPPVIEIGIDPSRRAEAGMLQGFVMQAMGQVLQDRFADPVGMRERLRREIRAIVSDAGADTPRRAALKGFLQTADEFLGSVADFTDSQRGEGEGSVPAVELAKVDMVEVTAHSAELNALLEKVRSPWDISFPSAIMWGVMGCVAGFAVSMVRERSEGTFLRLGVAPLSRGQILAGKAIACFTTALSVVAFMMILGRFLGIQLTSVGLLVMAAICVGLCFVGLMMLLSVLGKTEQSVAGAGWAIIIVMCMFGGAMMPLLFLPSFMRTLSHLSPVKWAILALEGAIWRGFTFKEMLFPCSVLLAIGAVSFVVGTAILDRTRD